ncbi:MAG: glycoside hydrolase family 127 protein, partial [Bernardetiaceae bacterium]|nr:glycoside hydrolase family 127 protein [Bernardetiaceae bacterium]
MSNRCLGWALGLAQLSFVATAQDYPVRPVPFTQVRLTSPFWQARLDTNRLVTIPFAFRKCEETGRIDNFAIAGKLKTGSFKGLRYDDSDVFKVIEGAAYTLAAQPDPALDRYLDDLILKIAAAQEPDGYLYTIRTIMGEKVPESSGKQRWSHLVDSHELYNLGHLYEAAVAHYQATGKRTLLNVALKSADLLVATFGEGKLVAVPGHQEIEIGLAKLYRLTGQQSYLDLAKFFLDKRGRSEQRKLYSFPWFNNGDPRYAQDHLPVLRQTEAVGHVVRANYMYAGMADVAALTGETAYMEAIKKLWANVTEQKLYVTGGVGSSHRGENYEAGYRLPNYSAYNETCAAIALVLWGHRLFLLTGEASYLDVVERALYNGVLSGVSQSGNRFFYPNPLAADGLRTFNQGFGTRAPWFQTSCCPTNLARLLPSLPGYVYAQQPGRVFVNLYMAGRATLSMETDSVEIEQVTNYPWDGAVRLRVNPAQPTALALHLRVPGWAREQPVPGNLYRYLPLPAPAKVEEDQAGTGAKNPRNGKTGRPTKKSPPAVPQAVPATPLDEAASPVVSLGARVDLPGSAGPAPGPGQGIRLKINGKEAVFPIQNGFAVVNRTWKSGDVVEIGLPMPVRRMVANPQVEADRELVALERGPLVYCLEQADNPVQPNQPLAETTLPDTLTLKAAFNPGLLGGSWVVRGGGLTAVPYHLWSHRGQGEMAVWLPRQADPSHYLLSYFRADDESLYLAHSPDGRTWLPLNQGQPVLRAPQLNGQKVRLRDPFIRWGADGQFHLVATPDRKGTQLVYARSPDLQHWDSLRLLPVMASVPKTVNVWAPEFVYDSLAGDYLVYFSSATEGETNFDAAHHRTWAVRTRDWRTFSAPKVLFDPGYTQIDATIVPLGSQFYLFYKDERGISTERKKHKGLRYALADQLGGPYLDPGQKQLTVPGTEGPMIFRRFNQFYLYSDHYLDGFWSLLQSDNLTDWHPTPHSFQIPPAARHGSVFTVPRAAWE